MNLKVCGLKHQYNIEELIQLPIDYMGLIFYNKSPRFVDSNLSTDFVKKIPKSIKKVGVFVNEEYTSMLKRISDYDLDLVQLHGEESPEMCAELKPYVKVIKAFSINDDFDFSLIEKYQSCVDYFLFDTPTTNYGGSGKIFNWQLLKNYKGTTPFFLSGGINEDYIGKIKQLNIPQLISLDINSKFEIKPGVKNIDQIKQFILKLNSYDNE
ncbi:MAG: phosphoribosylanthranilate isomerase [Bacteroidetes bacterium]|nr:phosphoribosylanthranilate isomerase [Bacteroidota bacterium]